MKDRIRAMVDDQCISCDEGQEYQHCRCKEPMMNRRRWSSAGRHVVVQKRGDMQNEIDIIFVRIRTRSWMTEGRKQKGPGLKFLGWGKGLESGRWSYVEKAEEEEEEEEEDEEELVELQQRWLWFTITGYSKRVKRKKKKQEQERHRQRWWRLCVYT